VEAFFGGPLNNFIHKGRYVVLVIFFIWSCVALSFSTQLNKLTKREEFLPIDHPETLAWRMSEDHFET
jgi:predicted RND superfamily exporter protein